MSLLEESLMLFMSPKRFSKLPSFVHSLLQTPSNAGSLKEGEVNAEETRASRGSVTLASLSLGQQVNTLHSTGQQV